MAKASRQEARLFIDLTGFVNKPKLYSYLTTHSINYCYTCHYQVYIRYSQYTLKTKYYLNMIFIMV